MHESALVADLIGRAEQLAGDPAAITRLSFRIGALAPVTQQALHHGTARLAAQRWGTAPTIDIDVATDPTDPAALTVTLASIGIGG